MFFVGKSFIPCPAGNSCGIALRPQCEELSTYLIRARLKNSGLVLIASIVLIAIVCKFTPTHEAINNQVEYTQQVAVPDTQAIQKSFIQNKIKKLNPKSDAAKLASLVAKVSQEENFDAMTLLSIIKHESTFNNHAKSNVGAIGLMQLLPSTAEYITKKNGIEWKGSSKLHEPEYNLKVGVQYFKYLEKKYNGNRKLALMAYNWGPGNVQKYLKKEMPLNPPVLVYAQNILSFSQKLHKEIKLLA